MLFARVMPEKPEFLPLYYSAKAIGGKIRPRGKFVELRWVKPSEAVGLLTTSVARYVQRLLIDLKKGGDGEDPEA